MIEDFTLLLIVLLIGVPTVLFALWAFFTRPSKDYYKISGGRLYRIRNHRGK